MKKINIIISFCILLVILFAFYDSRLVRTIDDAAREFFLSLRNEGLNELVLLFTYVGDAKVLGALCIISVIGLFLFNKWLNGVLLLASIGVSYVLNIGLKSIFGRERPPLENRLIQEDGFSFPSGNAMVGTSFYLFAAFLIYQRFKKPWILWLGVILPFLLGWSRVYAGVHYPSDILAGFGIGILFCFCLIFLAKSVDKNKRKTVKDNKKAVV